MGERQENSKNGGVKVWQTLPHYKVPTQNEGGDGVIPDLRRGLCTTL